MINLNQIETDLKTALKSRNLLAADTLRALKTRIQNDQIAKGRSLEEVEILALVSSEAKRRKEAAESFKQGGRADSAEKELAEIEVLSVYLPKQVSESDIIKTVADLTVKENWTVAHFGVAMTKLKAIYGPSADGAVIAKILKQHLV